jgi:hypothetical protein
MSRHSESHRGGDDASASGYGCRTGMVNQKVLP